MLETAPSLSIYTKDDEAVSGIEEQEERENGLKEEDNLKLMKSVKIGDTSEGSREFSFAKPTMDLIKEEETDELGEEIDGVEKMEQPNNPPMYLASEFGIMNSFSPFKEERENDEEYYYKELLNEFPNHPQVLKNYAQFLKRNGDFEGAEEYYFRAANVDPGDGEILSQYAILVWELHHDHERALTYFKLAAQAVLNNSNVLAAYAKFLWEVDDVQIEVGIDGFTESKDNPLFEVGELKNSYELEKYYRRMTEENPPDPTSLRNYAQFLYQSKGDLQGAEEYYSQFILANPQDGEMLLQYATLLWELYHDPKRTLSYMERAVHAAPGDSNILAAYARFLWSIDENEL